MTASGRKTGIALGVLVVLMIGAFVALFGFGGGGGESSTTARSTVATSARTRITTSTTRGPITYLVQRGDTITGIADKFGVPPDFVIDANQITTPDRLTEGQSLIIPAAPPVELVVTPAKTEAGGSVQLKLTGAWESEHITFQIDSPEGRFTSPRHTAPSDGTVAATYRPDPDSPVGTYTVTAEGDQGTSAQATFRVVRASSPE
jgi:LysM repeat protein